MKIYATASGNRLFQREFYFRTEEKVKNLTVMRSFPVIRNRSRTNEAVFEIPFVHYMYVDKLMFRRFFIQVSSTSVSARFLGIGIPCYSNVLFVTSNLFIS